MLSLSTINVGIGGGGVMGGGIGDGTDIGIAGSSSGIFDKIVQILNGLPVWLSTIIVISAVVMIAFIAGKIIGKIIGNLLYPDPDKENVFNRTQRIIIFILIVLTVGFSGFTIYNAKNPKINDDIMTGIITDDEAITSSLNDTQSSSQENTKLEENFSSETTNSSSEDSSKTNEEEISKDSTNESKAEDTVVNKDAKLPATDKSIK